MNTARADHCNADLLQSGGTSRRWHWSRRACANDLLQTLFCSELGDQQRDDTRVSPTAARTSVFFFLDRLGTPKFIQIIRHTRVANDLHLREAGTQICEGTEEWRSRIEREVGEA